MYFHNRIYSPHLTKLVYATIGTALHEIIDLKHRSPWIRLDPLKIWEGLLIQVTLIILKNNNKNILNNLIKQRPENYRYLDSLCFCVHLRSLSQFYPTLFVVQYIMFLKKVNPSIIQSTWNISTYYFLNLYRKGYIMKNSETCKEPNW